MKGKSLIRGLITLVFFFACSASLLAQEGNRTIIEKQPAPEPKIRGGVITLYALDPLARTFCFRDGQDGMGFYKNEVRNRCSDIDFNTYSAGGFSVGVEGGRIGTIIDLGSPVELRQRYGYEETVGNGQGFASLRVEDGKIVILKERKAHTMQELRESISLFQEGVSGAAAPIKIGHIYLLRLTDRREKEFQRIVKLMVLTYTPNESVTMRWEIL